MTDAQVRLERRSYTDPDAAGLIAALQDEYRATYGTPDDTPVEAGEFDPPDGLFLIAYDLTHHRVDGDFGAAARSVPVGSGAWRRHEDAADVVEIKRMYVAPAARGRGVARALVAELERTAAAAGARRVVLMTGGPQAPAIALYAACGYTPAAPYGYYADPVEYPDALFFGKDLPVPAGAGTTTARLADETGRGERAPGRA